MMAKAKKIIVNCADYNGHKNIPFMMSSDDFRLTDPRFKDDYSVIAEGKASDRNRLFVAVDGTQYTVHYDWSVTEIAK